MSEEEALILLSENPKIMYRPIFKNYNEIIVGFKEDNYSRYFL